MTYALVAPLVPLSPLQDELTYAVSTNLLTDMTVGRVVMVHVRGRLVNGVITALVRRKPARIVRLLSVERTTRLVLPPHLLALARQLRNWSWHSLGSCLAAILPPLLKQLPACEPPNRLTGSSAKPRQFAIVGSQSERWERYDDVVARAQRAGRSVLIVFAAQPTLAAYQRATRHEAITWLAEGKLSARWQQWAAVATTRTPQLVVGLRGSVTAPIPTLGLIIVDEPRGRGHKSDQAPYLTSDSIVRLRQRSERCHVAYGDVLPPLELVGTQRHQYRPVTILPANPADPTVLQVASEAWLQEHVGADRRLFILLNRVGAGVRRCSRCRTAVSCPRCQAVPIEERPGQLACLRCRWSGPVPAACAVCGNAVLVLRGTGTQVVAQRLATLGFANVAFLDRTQPQLPEPLPHVLVGTALALPHLGQYQPTASLVLGTDERRERSMFAAVEEALSSVQAVAAATDGPTAVETSHGDDPWYDAFHHGELDPLLKAELADRAAHAYPPAATLVLCRARERSALVTISQALTGRPNVVSTIGPYRRPGFEAWQLLLKLALRTDRAALFAPLSRQKLLDTVTIEPDPITETLD